MIKTVINGFWGRMGQEVSSAISRNSNFELVGGIDLRKDTLETGIQIVTDPKLVVPDADAIIDFSLPKGTIEVLNVCVKNRKPLVTGTTGLDERQMHQVTDAAKEIPIVQAANFSIGINLLSHLSGLIAKILKDAADIEITETHHRHKKDAPSGTALTLAKRIAERLDRSSGESLQFGRHGKNLKRSNEIGIHSLRGGSVIGEHRISFFGENENLILTHQALNRNIFADGALTAAEWVLQQSSGLYGMNDVLGF